MCPTWGTYVRFDGATLARVRGHGPLRPAPVSTPARTELKIQSPNDVKTMHCVELMYNHLAIAVITIT